MKVHFIAVKVSIIRGAHALVEPKCPVRFDPGLFVRKEQISLSGIFNFSLLRTTCLISNYTSIKVHTVSSSTSKKLFRPVSMFSSPRQIKAVISEPENSFCK